MPASPSRRRLSSRSDRISVSKMGRARANAMVANASGRLRLAATRAGGPDGLALACSLIDMIRAEAPPPRWPLRDMITLLEAPGTAPDRQTDRLRAELGAIAADLDGADRGAGIVFAVAPGPGPSP